MVISRAVADAVIDGQRVTLPDGRVFQTGSAGQGAPDGGAARLPGAVSKPAAQ